MTGATVFVSIYRYVSIYLSVYLPKMAPLAIAIPYHGMPYYTSKLNVAPINDTAGAV